MTVSTMGCYRWVFRSMKNGLFISLCLLQALPLLLAGTYPVVKCDPGHEFRDNQCIPCKRDSYWTMKQGQPICERCTVNCSASPYRLEVQSCSKTSNRQCRCVQGAFCDSPIQYTCRRCLPCPNGTFSDSFSLDRQCKKHQNCTSQGKVMIRKGTNTTDSVCGNKPTLLPTTKDLHFGQSTLQTQHYKPMSLTITLPSHPKEEKSDRIQNTTTTASIENPDKLDSSTVYLWLLLFGPLLFSALLLAFCKQKGAKLVQQYWRHSFSKYVKDEHIQQDDSNLKKGAVSPGHITMSHSGGGDGINNSVGSIYIYCPRTVVLGANSSVQSEDPGRKGESQPLISTPQQESLPGAYMPESGESGFEEGNSSRPPVVECMQEEYQKELSYPVPATGK